MDYFNILNLNREPFSNSPDPDFFFQSRQHIECLQKLELSLRLRRGLNVVIGDVGTGKTTLCRQIIRQFVQDESIETHLILDPDFSTPFEFLLTIAEMFAGAKPENTENDWQVKEVIKQHLFYKGVEQGKTVILIIDEGQKIPEFCFEILREFLNYETNQFKLLQIVLFAQKELDNRLARYANFTDRINLKHYLGPMTFSDTKAMIRFRLDQSSQKNSAPALFTYLALWTIYRKTGGYPRKIINLCHRCILTMIIQNQSRIGWQVVRSCADRNDIHRRKTNWRYASAGIAVVLLMAVAAGLSKGSFSLRSSQKQPVTVAIPQPSEPLFTGNPPPENSMAPTIEPKTIEVPHIANDKEAPPTDIAMVSVTDFPVESEIVSPPEIIDVTPALPSIIGTVTLKRNETLWRLQKTVYGICTQNHLNALLKANPSIKNPDHVERGQVIQVPGVPLRIDARTITGWWIEIEKMNHLESAVDFLRSYPADSPPVRILPYWNPRDGLHFSILVKECFRDHSSALERLEAMPLFIPKSTVLNDWNNHTVFFADPVTH